MVLSLIHVCLCTAVGMFEAEMSSDSWQLAGMADRGMLPTVLGQRYHGFLNIFSTAWSITSIHSVLQE